MKSILLAMLGALLSGCSATPLPTPSAPDPSDAQSPIVEPPYRPVLAGTVDYRPVAAKPWGAP